MVVITLIDLIRHVVDEDPARVAVVTPGTSLTYACLYESAARYASTLTTADNDGAVAVVCDGTDDTIPITLGALLTGRPVVLLPSTMSVGAREIVFRSTGTTVLARPGAAPGEAHLRPLEASSGVSPPAASVVFCTSGSTGHPKLVPLTASVLPRFAAWAAAYFGIGEGTRVLSYAPLNFDLSLLEVWTTLAHGGTVISAAGRALRDGGHLAGLMKTWQPDVVEGVPVLYERLSHGMSALDGTAALAARHVIMTGDNTPQPARRAIRGMFPDATYYNLYGSTETNDSIVAVLHGDEVLADRIPLGDPLPGVDVRLIDGDAKELAGPGVGELMVATPFQTNGYISAAGVDHGGFLTGSPAGPGAPGVTYFRTGDLVERRADGSLYFVGRRDFRIKVNGVSVDLEEVEDLIGRHDAVAEAVAVPWSKPTGETSVAAIVRTVGGRVLSAVDLRRFLATRADGAAVPFRITFISEKLPRTSTGKVDRHAAQRLLYRTPTSTAR